MYHLMLDAPGDAEAVPWSRMVSTIEFIFIAPEMPKKPNPSTDAAPATAPAEGERRAIRGYIGQYERAGAAIYAALERDELLWIGVADRNAGIRPELIIWTGCVSSLDVR